MSPPLPPGRLVELPGRGTTFVRETGPSNAPALFLLHGLSASADLNWFTTFRSLSSAYRVVALDQRGHGRGIRLRGRRFRLADCADDVVVLADALGIDRFVPVGYSMGGAVAQLVVHRQPERVAGLVLCATARNFTSNRPANRVGFAALAGMSAAARLTPTAVRRQVTATFLRGRAQEGQLALWVRSELLRNDPSAVMQAAVAIGNFSSRDWLGAVDVPAAVVVTTRDRLVPPPRQYKMAEAIRGATIHPVPGDHGVCVARPDLFVPALLDACRSVTGRAATVRP
ncbi:MAG TPA: alpha/beta hydrolase [Acidimicrobiales bacterium]|nr:alpha/beta hydrolase [Acidimicrobiales bacterium]